MPLTLLNSPPSLEGEPIRYQQCDIRMVITPPLSGVSDAGKGNLVVAESQLYFYSLSTTISVAIPYPSIIIHAISRQEGQPCVYCQLDSTEKLVEQRHGGRDDEDEDEDEVTEIRFVPDDAGALEYIYIALSECAALHPDKEFMVDQLEDEHDGAADDDDGYDYDNPAADTYTPSDPAELSEVGRAALAHLNSVFQMPSQRDFEQMVAENGHTNGVSDERFGDAEEQGGSN
ncbi:regulator of volume decrease after cellular swelling-domain-containing protein [Jimgerdemannia flammicorona]|uniref:Regulator of volume decrease after cellular swelling-domain-containing protein n=1 Tax=Jimgerdemannia flammicorona TaxID=994334 RepID=A0A433QVW4_9FUNG|nr:regulator of volume decrease after cellular swelling-domain-containing protein [Jimgerdemannia flammicorona]